MLKRLFPWTSERVFDTLLPEFILSTHRHSELWLISRSAIAPFLTAITITFPKLYLEVIGADVFGTREILRAEVVEKFRTEASLRLPKPVTSN